MITQKKLLSHLSQKGFTVTEMVVALALFGILTVTIVSVISSIQYTQRSERSLDLATTAARTIVEEARNGGYDALTAGQTYDRTSSVSELLPGRAATVAVSQSSSLPDMKRLEVTVSYKVGQTTRSVMTTAIVGRGGLAP